MKRVVIIVHKSALDMYLPGWLRKFRKLKYRITKSQITEYRKQILENQYFELQSLAHENLKIRTYGL